MIINKAKNESRTRGNNYYEEHHILPKCLGGNDDKSNLVLLKAREHYLCHKLLIRIYPNSNKIKQALHLMTHSGKYKLSSRDYEYLRENYPEPWNKGIKAPQCGHNKNKGKRNGKYGVKLSKEQKDKMTEGRIKMNMVNKLFKPNVHITRRMYALSDEEKWRKYEDFLEKQRDDRHKKGINKKYYNI